MTVQFHDPAPDTSSRSVLDLFDEAVALDPGREALRHGQRTLSYGELDAAADALAAALAQHGVSPGDVVAIAMATGIDYVVAMLAVLRAGCAYVPLAPALPPARIARMLALADCRHVLVDDEGRTACAPLAPGVALLDHAALASLPAPVPMLRAVPAPEQAACILFTSGSTGDPKGVRTLHGNLAYYAGWSRRFFAETAHSRVPLTAAPHYAAATSQVYACLCAGATLHILPGAIAQPARLLEFFAAHPGYALHCVPTVWRAVLDLLERGAAGRPAALFLSGEALPRALVDRTFAFDPALPVWNLYGPTECVANISARRLAPGQPIGIGDALPGSRLFVVDDAGREVAPGGEGRLLIAGPGVCPGYLGDEARSRAQFFEFQAGDGARVAVYDTGDRARRFDGDIELLGRRDGQVKLRGVRIETGDIEANLLRHDGVAQAAVLLAGEPEPCLVAFVEPKPAQVPDVAALRRHLHALLPPSMLPERWSIATLPRLANGKLDRAALRERLADVVADVASGRGPAIDATEARLAAIFDRVLGTRGSGAGADFFALGGDSLKAHSLLAAIEEQWAVELPFGMLYAEPTVAALARALRAAPTATATATREAPGATDGALSVAQRGLWLLQQAYPDSSAYNLCYRIDFETPLDAARVRACIDALCGRHPLLDACLATRDGAPCLRPAAATALDFDLLDADDEDALDAALRALARRPLAREGARLHAWRLLRSPRRQVLAFAVHHLVFDGVSASLLLRELFESLAGREPAAPTGRYADFVAREARDAQSPQRQQDREYWRRRLAGLAAQPAFPVQYHGRGVAPFAGGRLRVVLDAPLRARLAALARREDCSLHVLLLTAFGAVLDRHEPGADFLVAAPFANRRRADERDVLGYFTAVLFYRLQWQAGTPLRALAARVREDTIALLDHQRLPFPELAALLRERLGTLPAGVFRLMFGYHDTTSWRGIDGVRARASEWFGGEAKCDLHLECFDDGDTLELALTYREAAIDAAAANDLLDAYRGVVERLEALLPLQRHEWPAPAGALAERILHAGDGGRDERVLCTVAELLRPAFERHAARPAVWHDGVETSYAELAARAAALATLLPDPMGEGGDAPAPVAICMPHQPALLVALLACACRGIPYVPLDPAFPPQRIATILESSGARRVLVGAGTPDAVLPATLARIDVARMAPASDACLPVAPALAPSATLYIIYTSGSTGQPKGVVVPQRGVANYLAWMQRRFEVGAGTRVLARTSISFDISTWELLLPLLGGGCVVLADRVATESPEQLARVIEAGGANVLQFVPSGLRLFVEAGMLAQVRGVRRVFCGGEALPRTLVERVFDSGYDGELYNLYGPTEASIFMTCHPCRPDGVHASVPIGRPIPNSTLYVLDERLRLLPPNVAGDLYIGGAVLADGYRGDAPKTRQAFIDAPPWLPDARLYRTGDKGRLLSDGSFEYLGRDDQQVKIRGYRVELREIEQHMLAHPGVREAIAFTRLWGDGDLRLHAAYVARDGATPGAAELAAWLRARLPAWMLPSTMPRVDAVPCLANGKTDYHRLRALVESEPAPGAAPPVVAAGRDGIERTLAAIWREVLGHGRFDAQASFFDAGGHSMLFLRMRELLRERLGTEFTIAELYGAPNIAELARAYRGKSGATVAPPMVARIRERVARRRTHLKNGGSDP